MDVVYSGENRFVDIFFHLREIGMQILVTI